MGEAQECACALLRRSTGCGTVPGESKLLHRVRASRERYKGRLYRVLAAVAVHVVILDVFVGFHQWNHRKPELVDPADHNLTTLEGQKQFAEAIRDDGLGRPIWQDVLLYGVTLSLFFVVVATALLGGRRSIPRSIVAHRVHRERRESDA